MAFWRGHSRFVQTLLTPLTTHPFCQLFEL